MNRAVQDALRQRGSASSAVSREWHDYQHVDAVLAIRDCPPVVLATKPASKLINAWKAGVPALLGPEPAWGIAYSPLDFLEAASAEPCWTPRRLQQESGLYRRMTEHGAKRAQAFDEHADAKVARCLRKRVSGNRRETRNPLRYARYLWNRQKINLEKGCLAGGMKHTAAASAQIRNGEFENPSVTMRRTRDKGRPARRGISRGQSRPVSLAGWFCCAWPSWGYGRLDHVAYSAKLGAVFIGRRRVALITCFTLPSAFMTPVAGVLPTVSDARPCCCRGCCCSPVGEWGALFRFVREPAGMASHTRAGAAPLGDLAGLVGDFL